MQFVKDEFVRSARRAAKTARDRTKSFIAKDESGNLVIFALCLFVAMTAFGGLAVDVMRYETVRTRLQNTLDRSTLAAASLTQALDAEAVVTDYFDKAGLLQYLTGIEVDEGINYREVSAQATASTEPYFMHMVGIDSFDASGISTAEQRVTNVEIALVLDVSGSMASNSRLVNLKTAAKEFIDTVLDSDDEDRISISLVPFNGQVNLGATLRAKYNAIDNHGVSGVNCIDLASGVYSSTEMSTTTAMSMTAHADTYSTTSTSTSFVSATSTDYATPNAANRWCPPSTTNIVRLPSNNATTIKSQIDGLTAIGATSINAGMKWGTALLDPGSRTMFSELISASQIDAAFSGRPYDYIDDDSMKIVVLMTDGEHFAEERVKSAYKSGLSPIYRSTGDGNFSIKHTTGRPSAAGTNQFWVPHLCTSDSCKSGSNVSTGYRSAAWNSGSGVTQLTWPQVWSYLRVSYVAWQLYARGLSTSSSGRSSTYATWLENLRDQTDTGDMNTQLQTICTQAKNNGVIVYGIAFEAPSGGQTQIRNCASDTAHYFSATGLQIRTAFRTIASNISQLRLTQ